MNLHQLAQLSMLVRLASMTQFRPRPRESPEFMKQLNDAREREGVHIYWDRTSDYKDTCKPTSPLFKDRCIEHCAPYVVSRTPIRNIVYTSVHFALDTPEKVEAGFLGPNRIIFRWTNDNKMIIFDYNNTIDRLGETSGFSKGHYFIVSLELTMPYTDGLAELKARVNGVDKGKFWHPYKTSMNKFIQEYATGCKSCAGVTTTEHHLHYYGITDHFEQESENTRNWISLKFATTCQISGGGSAEIKGFYRKMNDRVNGILIGIDNGFETKTRIFSNYSAISKSDTYRVTVGEFITRISSSSGCAVFQLSMPDARFAWLLLENIYVTNMTVHTGRSFYI